MPGLIWQRSRAAALADRVSRMVALRHRARDQRRLAIVLFNFPPNAGNTGTAAHLNVFESLMNTLRALADQGYAVDVPESVAQASSAAARAAEIAFQSDSKKEKAVA